MIDTKLMSMRTSLECKRFSCGFVLAASLMSRSVFADDLPPPPPPPPGANPALPTAPVGTGVLDAPPPPPPGKTVEPAPTPQTAPTPPPPPPASTSTIPGLAEPPPPPPGVEPPPEPPKPPKKKPRTPRQTAAMPGYSPPSNTSPNYTWKDKETSNTKWYGWQSLIGVVPSQAMFAIGWFDRNPTLLFIGAVGSIISSPIVHRANGQGGRGWASFAGNTGTLLIGALIGEEVGAGVGLAVWTFLDISLLHHKPVKPEEPKNSALGIHSWAVIPMMENGRQGLSVVGQF